MTASSPPTASAAAAVQASEGTNTYTSSDHLDHDLAPPPVHVAANDGGTDSAGPRPVTPAAPTLRSGTEADDDIGDIVADPAPLSLPRLRPIAAEVRGQQGSGHGHVFQLGNSSTISLPPSALHGRDSDTHHQQHGRSDSGRGSRRVSLSSNSIDRHHPAPQIPMTPLTPTATAGPGSPVAGAPSVRSRRSVVASLAASVRTAAVEAARVPAALATNPQARQARWRFFLWLRHRWSSHLSRLSKIVLFSTIFLHTVHIAISATALALQGSQEASFCVALRWYLIFFGVYGALGIIAAVAYSLLSGPLYRTRAAMRRARREQRLAMRERERSQQAAAAGADANANAGNIDNGLGNGQGGDGQRDAAAAASDVQSVHSSWSYLGTDPSNRQARTGDAAAEPAAATATGTRPSSRGAQPEPQLPANTGAQAQPTAAASTDGPPPVPPLPQIQPPRPPRGALRNLKRARAAATRLQAFVNVLGLFLLLFASYWLVILTECIKLTPTLFYGTLAAATVFYLRIVVPLVICSSVACCLPAMLSIMRMFGFRDRPAAALDDLLRGTGGYDLEAANDSRLAGSAYGDPSLRGRNHAAAAAYLEEDDGDSMWLTTEGSGSDGDDDDEDDQTSETMRATAQSVLGAFPLGAMGETVAGPHGGGPGTTRRGAAPGAARRRQPPGLPRYAFDSAMELRCVRYCSALGGAADACMVHIPLGQDLGNCTFEGKPDDLPAERGPTPVREDEEDATAREGDAHRPDEAETETERTRASDDTAPHRPAPPADQAPPRSRWRRGSRGAPPVSGGHNGRVIVTRGGNARLRVHLPPRTHWWAQWRPANAPVAGVVGPDGLLSPSDLALAAGGALVRFAPDDAAVEPGPGGITPATPAPGQTAAAPMCVVCLSTYADDDRLALLPCAHHLHWGCARSWATVRRTCPLCNTDVLTGRRW